MSSDTPSVQSTYVEWLTFRVQPEWRSQFIELDRQIWTAALAQNPAFVRKEVWLNPDQADEVIAVIHWSDRDQWKAIPAAKLEQIEHRFQAAISHIAPETDVYELIEAKEYHLLSADPITDDSTCYRVGVN